MMERAEDQETKDYIEEMRKVKAEMKLDDNYFKKFGMLKKAAVLLYYERENEAMDEIAKAVEIAKEQRKSEAAKNEAIQRRWQFKLGIDEIEIPAQMLKTHPDQVTDKELQAVVGDNGVPLATARLYLQKISPVLNDQYDKNVYLDAAIEDLYLHCENKITGKMSTIERIKEKITKLEEMADMEEMIGSDQEAPEMFDDDGKPIKVKIQKKKMCESMLKTGKCKNTAKKCKYAHNPIELELLGASTKISNLQTAVRSLDKSMRSNKSTMDWLPAS